MSSTIIVAGFGPGISTGVAERFGREGYAVALVGRTEERLEKGAAALKAAGVRAQAFTADLGNPEDARGVIGRARDALGPIAVLHWNAYATAAGDLLTASAADLHAALDIATIGLTSAVQAVLPDLRAAKGSLLVTNGGFGMPVDGVDAAGVQYNAMGLSVANAAKHKLVRLLAVKLKGDGVYVGEVMVTGTIKGSAYDRTNTGTLDPARVAEVFWALHSQRKEQRVTV